MQLDLNVNLAERYSNQSQRARVVSEDWVRREAFCPNCGHNHLAPHPNNTPVGDFFCEACREDFELKSSSRVFGRKITDGPYRTMLERMREATNPSCFLLQYDLGARSVSNFLVIPKYFFVPNIIEERTALSEKARRAGLVGCNILVDRVAESGKVYLVRDRRVFPKREVCEAWKSTRFLSEAKKLGERGWLLDMIGCVEKVGRKEFSLAEMYRFEPMLREAHPENHFIQAKIRQQLQVLRDRGFVRFVGRGMYRRTAQGDS